MRVCVRSLEIRDRPIAGLFLLQAGRKSGGSSISISALKARFAGGAPAAGCARPHLLANRGFSKLTAAKSVCNCGPVANAVRWGLEKAAASTGTGIITLAGRASPGTGTGTRTCTSASFARRRRLYLRAEAWAAGAFLLQDRTSRRQSMCRFMCVCIVNTVRFINQGLVRHHPLLYRPCAWST